MLYIVCAWVLLRRKRNGFMWQLTSSTLLFALETINLALEAAEVLCQYFIEISIAENWPYSPYFAFRLNRINFIVQVAVEVANLLCLCVQSQISDVAFLTVIIRLAGWLISYWHASLNLSMRINLIIFLDLPLLYYLESAEVGACNSNTSFLTEHCQ
jgi:hypothetical protein